MDRRMGERERERKKKLNYNRTTKAKHNRKIFFTNSTVSYEKKTLELGIKYVLAVRIKLLNVIWLFETRDEIEPEFALAGELQNYFRRQMFIDSKTR